MSAQEMTVTRVTTCIVWGVLLLAASGCHHRSSATAGLTDAIEDASKTLRASAQSKSAVDYVFEGDEAWSLVFVPAGKLDQTLLEAANVPTEMRDTLEMQARAWGPIPLLLYTARQTAGITRMPTTVTIEHQVWIRSSRPRCRMSIELSRNEDAISLLTAQCLE